MIAVAGGAAHVLVFHVPTLHGGRPEYRSNSLDQLAPPPNTPTGWRLLSPHGSYSPDLRPASPHLTSPHLTVNILTSHHISTVLIILIDINQIKSISSYMYIN